MCVVAFDKWYICDRNVEYHACYTLYYRKLEAEAASIQQALAWRLQRLKFEAAIRAYANELLRRLELESFEDVPY